MAAYPGIVTMLMVLAVLCDQSREIVKGTLTVAAKTYDLKHALAYERESTGEVFQKTEVNGVLVSTYGEPVNGSVIVLLASSEPVSTQQAKALHDPKARRKAFIDSPFIEVTIDKKSGKAIWFQGWAGGTSFVNKSPECAKIQLTLDKDNVHGHVLDQEAARVFENERVDFHFHVPLQKLGNVK